GRQAVFVERGRRRVRRQSRSGVRAAGPQPRRPGADGDAGDFRRNAVHSRLERRHRHQTEMIARGFMRLQHVGIVGAVVAAGALGVSVSGQGGADWPQWRGPNRDGAVSSFSEPKPWPEQLTRKWKIDVGLGYASPVLIGNRVYVYSRQGENEILQALEAETAKRIWQSAYPAPFTINPAAARHEKGPKSTPTFANGKLFTLGMSGIV